MTGFRQSFRYRSVKWPDAGAPGRSHDREDRALYQHLTDAVGRHRPHRHSTASRAGNIMPLELIFRPVDVPEPLQRIRAQGETEAPPVRRMDHAVRTNVEWLVEELPHHRHVALAHLKNVAVGGCHRNVNACGK